MKYELNKKTSLEFQQRLADALVEEACRQWCDFIDDAPERLDGTGFAHFHREICEQKSDEYAEIIAEEMEIAPEKSHSSTNLEKYYEAKTLIEEKTNGKQEFSYAIGGMNIRPADDACVGLQMNKTYDYMSDTMKIDFSAYIHRSKNNMSAEETQAFAAEIQTIADILKEVNGKNIVFTGDEIAEWENAVLQDQHNKMDEIIYNTPKMEM